MVLERILNLDKEERLADLSTLSTRKKNILSDLEVNIAGEVQDKGGNLWGLFSGITKYTTHGLKGIAMRINYSGYMVAESVKYSPN